MRAWKLDAPGGPLRLADVPDPEPRPGGVVLDVLAAHVPAYTDQVVAGPRGLVPTPLVLGAAGVGRVRAVGEGVFGLAPGDVVVDTSLLASGDAAAPEEVLLGWTGIGGRGVPSPTTEAMWATWRDGLFAERALRPRAVLERLPGAEEHEDLARLAFLPWLGIAAGALDRAEQGNGDVVCVMGATGQLGGAAVLLALARGAARVVAAGRSVAALERLAAVDPRVRTVATTGDRATDAAALRAAAGGDAEVVVDALGAVPGPDLTLAAYDAVAVDGTMVLVGGVRQELPLPYGDLMHRRITLRGSWMAPAGTALRVWRLVQSGQLRLDALEVHPVGLDDPTGALELAARTAGLAVVVLLPDTESSAV